MKIFDTVHGFIHLSEVERALIDTEPFQRMRYIHQLGISYLVYPGGTHTRFEHSLGAMHLASQIFDRIETPKDEKEYWRQMVRLAALCHDLGHLPFSHVAESRLLEKGGHETWTLRIIESEYLAHVWEMAEKAFPGYPVKEHVGKFALGVEKMKEIRPETSFDKWERVYAQIIAGDFFGADRIDYLLRDAKSTGVSYGLFDYAQLIEMLVVVEDGEGSLKLGVEENGIESCEALLLARHFMQRRVYQYPSAKAYSFHLARFMEELYKDPAHFSTVESYLAMSEAEVLCALAAAKKDPTHPGHLDAASLYEREKRFQAIRLPGEIKIETLESFQEKEKISQANIHWDLHTSPGFRPQISLPILRKNAEIIQGGQFSEITIPPTKKNWLYLAPEYTFKV